MPCPAILPTTHRNELITKSIQTLMSPIAKSVFKPVLRKKNGISTRLVGRSRLCAAISRTLSGRKTPATNAPRTGCSSVIEVIADATKIDSAASVITALSGAAFAIILSSMGLATNG